MSTVAEKTEAIKNSGAAAGAKESSGPLAAAALPDRRPTATAQRQAQAAIAGSPQLQQAATLQRAIDGSPRQQAAPAPVQKKENETGLPDHLKAGVENLSGHSLDDVQVHYNSAKPAQLQAHAYAQGTDIHVAPGQEQHLPHEAWHVVQQKQGRVRPTMQLKGKVAVNDDAGLEKEADVMGGRALQFTESQKRINAQQERQELTSNDLQVNKMQDSDRNIISSNAGQLKRNEAYQLMRIRNKVSNEEKEHDDSIEIPDGWEEVSPGYNTNVRMGNEGKRKHSKKEGEPTTVGDTTKRKAKTLNRHIERIKAGEGKVTGTVPGGAGEITIVRLESTKPGNTPHIYGIKKPDGKTGESGIHPRTPISGGEYDSDSDED
jgi:hypothetical protein